MEIFVRISCKRNKFLWFSMLDEPYCCRRQWIFFLRKCQNVEVIWFPHAKFIVKYENQADEKKKKITINFIWAKIVCLLYILLSIIKVFSQRSARSSYYCIVKRWSLFAFWKLVFLRNIHFYTKNCTKTRFSSSFRAKIAKFYF